MADRLTKCTACSGRGYFRCDCWPADCICGQDEDTCWECNGDGWIDPSYDYFGGDFAPLPTSHPDEDAGDDVKAEGESRG